MPLPILAILFFLAVGSIAGAVGLVAIILNRKRSLDLEARNRDLEARLSRLESAVDEIRLSGLRLDREEPVKPPPVETPAEERPEQVRPADLPPTVPEFPEMPPESSVAADHADVSREVPYDSHRPAEAEPWWAGLEESIGKRWTTWAGALALFVSAGFFLKYAFENQWLGPTGRVVLGIVTGLVLLVVGDYSVRRQMRALGQGLMGGALAILYVSLFAAFSLYDIIPQIPAFAAMVVVTAAGMTLAILHNSVALSFLAVLGGFLTPLMVSTGQDARDSLFAYLVVLDLGVLGVAIFKRWRALDALAFLGTWALFAGWFFSFYRDAALLPTMLWVIAFFLVFLIVPFIYQLRLGTTSSVESFIMALGNAVVTCGFAYLMLHEDYQYILGFAALAMAACYVVLAVLLRRRVPEDARTLFGFVGLSVVLVTLAIPLHLKLHGITLAWAIEAPVLVYLGYLYRYRPIRIAGFLVLVLAVLRLFDAHWPFHSQLYVLFLNRYFGAAMCVPAAAAVYAFVHHRYRSVATNVDRYLMYASAISAAYLALTVLSGEVAWWLEFQAYGTKMNWRYLAHCLVGVIWAAGAACFLLAALRLRSEVSFYAGLLPLVVALGISVSSYFVNRHHDYLIFLNVRFALGMLAALAAGGFAWVADVREDLFSERSPYLSMGLRGMAALFPLVLLSAEAYTYCLETISSRRRARWTGLMALSVVWGVYAVVWLAVGFWQKIRAYRLAALGLLAVVLLKVVLVDMAAVKQIYRILSFVVLGLMMISASYLYHRLEKRLVDATGENE